MDPYKAFSSGGLTVNYSPVGNNPGGSIPASGYSSQYQNNIIPASGYGPQYANNVASQGVLGASTNTVKNPQPTPTPQPSAPTQPSQPDPIQQAFDAVMGGINSQEQTLRDQQPSIQNDINSAYNTSKSTLDTQNQSNLRDLTTQEQQGGQRKEDALTAATRLYNELLQGGQQRFGGASSAGEAYSALAGRELQRNDQTIFTNYDNFMGQIANAKQNLNDKYSNALLQLETQKNAALNQAQRDFSDKLSQIAQIKAGAESDKDNARFSALQDLRNQVFQINLAVAQQQNSVNSVKQQLEDQIASYGASAGQQMSNTSAAGQSYAANTPLNYNTSLTYGGGDQAVAPTPTGAIASNNKDQYPYNIFN